MAMKLYVGGLPYSMGEGDLEKLFAEHGTVASVAIIKDRETNQSKGFGFVEFADDAEANKAMEALNGSDQGGRSLMVNEARPQVDRRDSNGGGGGGRRY